MKEIIKSLDNVINAKNIVHSNYERDPIAGGALTVLRVSNLQKNEIGKAISALEEKLDEDERHQKPITLKWLNECRQIRKNLSLSIGFRATSRHAKKVRDMIQASS